MDASRDRVWWVREGLEIGLGGEGPPAVMGVINATPDSFSDGGERLDPGRAAAAAVAMVRDGAAVVDVGGESTRPGAARVSAGDQIDRVVPVIREIRRALAGAGLSCAITVDTTLSEVAAAALGAGADAVNDVSGGSEDAGLLGLCAERRCGVVLMHRLREPGEDSYSDRYAETPAYAGGVVSAVGRGLVEMAGRAVGAGVPAAGVLVDPGLGFGKSVEQNLDLVRGIGRLRDEVEGVAAGVLIGASRKSFVGRVSAGAGEEPAGAGDRLGGSIAFAVASAARGAGVLRVHDVRETVRALRAWWAIEGGE